MVHCTIHFSASLSFANRRFSQMQQERSAYPNGRRHWSAASVLLAGLLLAACAGGHAQPAADPAESAQAAPEGATGTTIHAAVLARHHMVVAANPLAAEAGEAILQAGGSAVDAAIAVQMVLTLVEPQSSGIGGGGFLMHFDAQDATVTAYDGRETAPAAATPDMFLNPDGTPMEFDDAVVGGLSVGVPGVLRMLELAHREHGRLPWAQLFEPAIRLAEQGFLVSPRLNALIAEEEYLKGIPASAAYFYGPDGAPLAVGSRLRNPMLAATLRTIAAGGADAFYRGPIAEDIVAAVKQAPRQPGRLAVADLAAYQPRALTAACGPYRVYLVCGMPPPSSGGVATLQILGMLDHFQLANEAPESAPAVHLIAEASRLAFADRGRYLADDEFVAVPVDALLDADYLAQRASLISPAKSLGKAQPGELPGQSAAVPPTQFEPVSTSHMSIVDDEGNAVSFTTSIEGAFGSHLMVRGFLLNNQLTDFSFTPAVDGVPVANRVQPGKRPRSSMSPLFVFDANHDLRLVIGSPGGSSIIGYVVKTVVAVVDWDLDPQEAVALPNFLNRNGATELEEGTPLEALRPALEALGHEVKLVAMTSGLHGIAVTPAGLASGVDPRREGAALGE
jgi:gamma-glutamyltranspeptidase/glutathione hydrolase